MEKGKENNMELAFSITELSNLTGKTRPTLYKYVKAYEEGNYDDIPYSFIQLFNLMTKENVKRKEIIDFCEANFKSVDSDMKVNDVINLIKTNKDKLDLDNLKKIIEEELKK